MATIEQRIENANARLASLDEAIARAEAAYQDAGEPDGRNPTIAAHRRAIANDLREMKSRRDAVARELDGLQGDDVSQA